MKSVPAESSISQTSRSSTSRIANSENARRQRSSLDGIFPLFDEMFKLTNMPWILGFILVAYVMLQVYAVSMWPGFKYAQHFGDTPGQIYKYFQMICLISDLEDTEDSYTMSFLICTVMVFVTVVVVAIQTFAYMKMRRFVTWALLVVRFFIEFIPIILIIPMANFLGSMFLAIARGTASTTTVIYFLVTILYFLFVVFVMYIQSTFSSISPYISTSPSSCWDGSFQFTYLMILCGCTFLSYVVQLYGTWLDFVVVSVKILLMIYLVMRMKQHPYIHTITNEIIIAVFTSSVLLDIIMLLSAGGMSITHLVDLICIAAGFLVSMTVWHFVYKWLVNMVAKNLTYEALEEYEGGDEAAPLMSNTKGHQALTLGDPDKRAHFMKLNLHKDFQSCRGYIRIGLAHKSEMFLDWSLFKFIAEFHDTEEAYAIIAQFITFFPGESRMLKVYFSQLGMKPQLSMAQRFLLFQIGKIVGLRQSSCSTEVTEQLIALKRLTTRGVSAAHGFWEDPTDDIDMCYQLHQFSTHSSAIFGEAGTNWPNNVRLAEEHARFLVECCTNFTDGVKQKHRGNLIEQGKNFAIDYSFRSLIRAFPEYLKKGFVDMKGNIMARKAQNGNASGHASQSSSGSRGDSQMSTGTVDGELDVEIEDEVSKSMFSMHRLRLAFQRSLMYRKCKYSNPAKVLAVVGALFFAALLVFMFVYYYSLYDSIKDYMDRVYLMSQVRYGLSMALVCLSTFWMREEGIMPMSLWNKLVSAADERDENNIHFSRGMINESVRWTAFGRTGLRDFLAEAVLLGAEGEDVESFMGIMIRPHTKWNFCLQDRIIKYDLIGSLKSILAFMFLRIRELTITHDGFYPVNNASEWNSNENLCEIQHNVATVMAAFEVLQSNISSKLSGERDKMDNTNKVITLVVVVGYTAIMLTATLFVMLNFAKEIRFLLRLMKGLDDQVKKDAAKPFKSDSSLSGDNETSNNEALYKGHLKMSTVLTISIGLIVVGAAVLAIMLILSMTENDEFYLRNEWLLHGIQRAPYISATVYSLLVGLAVQHGKINLSYTSWDIMSERIQTNVMRLITANDNLLRGTNGLEGVVGRNEDLDNLHFGEICSGEPSETLHEAYRCATIDKLVVTYKTFTFDVLRDPDHTEYSEDSTLYHMLHLCNDHIITLLFQAADILLDNANIEQKSFHTILTILLVVGIFYAILQMIIVLLLAFQLDGAYSGALQLLRRVPPLACSQHQALLNYLLNKKAEKSEDKMTSSKSVIFMSSDSVFCLNKNESIEVVNQSVTTLFGYTPEQLLGQSINTILPEDACQDVFQQMQLMKTGQCPMVFETHGIGKTDDDQSIPVYINLLGIAENGEAKSFAVILRDETEVQKQKEAAEKAKAQSERLLYQILPRDIVVRLNRGETDISFSVPSATIIFVDIVRWSDYSAALSPSQIMQNLSQVFAKFDALTSKYPLITKIKLIGDVYMAAAGLFTPDEPPSSHASQVVQFGLDVLGAVEEVNNELESSLQVRIGVNTDGPLIAGVLGTDKPTFDIIGDPINVSSRLQSTCIPSTVQISEMTYQAISDMNFNIEQRGEIELKGKGKRMAYIVRPSNVGSFFFGSQSSDNAGAGDSLLND